MSEKQKKTSRTTKARNAVAALVFVAVCAGIVLHTGWGTLSAPGVGDIALLCPVGSLESMLGSWAFAPRALVLFGAAVLITLLVGKSFCSWACPVPHLSHLFESKKARAAREEEQRKAAELANRHAEATIAAKAEGKPGARGGTSGSPVPGGQKRLRFDSRHFVLLGALGSTAVFGFPVFCIVCPVGLTFATVVAFVYLVGFNEPSIGLIVFPAILVAELVFLRKWCFKVCPISALMSLVAAFNRTLRPKVDAERCRITAAGKPCAACTRACPAHIDLHGAPELPSATECTRCNRCADACPEAAISFTKAGAARKAAQQKAVGEAD